MGQASGQTVSQGKPARAIGSVPAAATVGTSSASALAANGSRSGLVLVNTSANWIYLGLDGNAAVVGSGIALAPNGGAWTMGPATMSTGQIFAIASGASSNLSIQEFT